MYHYWIGLRHAKDKKEVTMIRLKTGHLLISHIKTQRFLQLSRPNLSSPACLDGRNDIGCRRLFHSVLVPTEKSIIFNQKILRTTPKSFITEPMFQRDIYYQYICRSSQLLPEKCLSFESKSFQPFICKRFQSTQTPHGSDPNRESRRHYLLVATYISCFIGVVMVSAVMMKQYRKLANSAIGLEELKDREHLTRSSRVFKYRGYVLTDFVASDVRSIHTFEVRPDDVWIVTFPKAGTTWLQEIVYLICNDMDFEKAAGENIDTRFPYFEFPYPGKAGIKAMSSPRCIKSHLPLSLLPNEMKEKKPKMIYLARNPKDTVVSYHHYMVKFFEPSSMFRGSFDDFCDFFLDDKILYGPWWKHVLEAWNKKDEDNFLFLFYEDMKMDPSKVVRQVSDFLERPLTDNQVEAIVKHCSLENMRTNETVSYNWLRDQGLATKNKDINFYRKGEVGDWRNHLSEEMAEKFDQMVETRLAPAGVPIRDSILEDTARSVRSKL